MRIARTAPIARRAAVGGDEGDGHEEGLRGWGGRADQLVRAGGDEVSRVNAGIGARHAVLGDGEVVEVVGGRVDGAVPVAEARRYRRRRVTAVAVEELAHVHGPVAGRLQ